MPLLISLLINFAGIWLMITAFKPKTADKTVKSLILAIVFVSDITLLAPFGIPGSVIAGIINLILIMKMLSFDLFSGTLFAIGAGLLNGALLECMVRLSKFIK
jgi:hypothetical protein